MFISLSDMHLGLPSGAGLMWFAFVLWKVSLTSRAVGLEAGLGLEDDFFEASASALASDVGGLGLGLGLGAFRPRENGRGRLEAAQFFFQLVCYVSNYIMFHDRIKSSERLQCECLCFVFLLCVQRKWKVRAGAQEWMNWTCPSAYSRTVRYSVHIHCVRPYIIYFIKGLSLSTNFRRV